jgi:hypothetical protein
MGTRGRFRCTSLSKPVFARERYGVLPTVTKVAQGLEICPPVPLVRYAGSDAVLESRCVPLVLIRNEPTVDNGVNSHICCVPGK